jgi:two-component system, cell cycle response regulator
MWILESTADRDGQGFVFRLAEGETRVIGRASRADFIVDAALVSRLHCRLSSQSPHHVDVVDLESTNGTYVNDRRIAQGTLQAGDTLRVGRVELAVRRE